MSNNCLIHMKFSMFECNELVENLFVCFVCLFALRPKSTAMSLRDGQFT